MLALGTWQAVNLGAEAAVQGRRVKASACWTPDSSSIIGEDCRSLNTMTCGDMR